MGIKRKSRELIIQTIYALSFTVEDNYLNNLNFLNNYKDVLENIASENKITTVNKVYSLADTLLRKMIPLYDEIDEIIQRNLGNIKMNKLGLIDLIILRLAVFEMIFEKTPPVVMINEAIDLTKMFSAEKSPSLINAILDRIKIREIDGVLNYGVIEEIPEIPASSKKDTIRKFYSKEKIGSSISKTTESDVSLNQKSHFDKKEIASQNNSPKITLNNKKKNVKE